jgi:uncharacterized protein (DUF305 family)
MRIGTSILGALILSLMLARPVVAQDTRGMESALPEICRTAGTERPSGQSMDDMSGMASMDEAQQAFMAGMMKMRPPMLAGIMAEDTDVAFVCGMIPHHQGAIDMARVELKYGDDDWAKAMAQKIIDSQEKEIAAMKDWLEEQAK